MIRMGWIVVIVLTVGSTSGLPGQQEPEVTEKPTDAIAEAAAAVNRTQSFLLQHRLESGETVRWRVEHVTATRTRNVGQHEEEVSTKTVSTKQWRVIDVDQLGQMTFQQSVEDLSLWQRRNEEKPITFDSAVDNPADAPPAFETLIDSIGKPLVTVTISPSGRVVDRSNDSGRDPLGIGEIVVPFPEEPIRVGHQWSVNDQVAATHSDRRVKQIKLRRVFRLTSVKDQVATIAVKSEILTPIEDPRIMAQIMQKQNQGTIQFDLARGRIIEREIDWNQTVQGFQGADSRTEYLCRFADRLIPTRKGGEASVTNELVDVAIKPNDGLPILRNR